ncbi:glycosyltransferase family 1 protein [Sediminicoccus sp. KRV36]|uniref:glycosyltransferase family 4 protein n=1 Tax=Sediminicoccus sp. KRV36 TaxID=3133721 RepID=UPI002010BEA6|nr:glycosyltransferase family 1 protein [Sediminicoccus rosea]UPY35471.1 glycosyltransferase family 4 protein [Sediminicoccus rosea]
MIAINGRFLTQGLTGVQRYAREMTRALDALVAAGEAPAMRLIAPPGAEGLADFPNLAAAITGTRGGQLWEQLDLPRAAAGDFLLNLGNTAPVAQGRNQAVVIHDAGVFDTPESYSWKFRNWYRGLQRMLVFRHTQILSVSAFSAGRIATHLGLDATRIGVTLEGGEHILREVADGGILARHGLTPRGYALVIGTGAAHKNLAALQHAIGALAARGLVLAVAGAKDAAVFRQDGAPPSENVKPLGRVSDAELRALYESALCLVFPSRYEGFGLPPVEAMWCGCPVIASRAGAVPEVCADAALWFDAARPETLGEAVAALADAPAERAALVAAGHARTSAFSWDLAARRLLGFLPR